MARQDRAGEYETQTRKSAISLSLPSEFVRPNLYLKANIFVFKREEKSKSQRETGRGSFDN